MIYICNLIEPRPHTKLVGPLVGGLKGSRNGGARPQAIGYPVDNPAGGVGETTRGSYLVGASGFSNPTAYPMNKFLV